MSKNKQILIWSLVGLLVLGAVTAILLLTAPQKETDGTGTDTGSAVTNTAADSELVLFDREESEVVSIKVSNTEGGYTILPTSEKDEEGDILWTVEGIESAPFNTTNLSAAAGYGVFFEAKEFVEDISDSADLAKYGLSEPQATVETTLTDGTVFSFKIGDPVPNSSTSMYMTADGKTVYTCYRSRVDSYLKNKYSYVDLTAIPNYDAASEEILKMTIERIDLDEPIVIEMIPASEDEDKVQVYAYRLTSPYYAYMDLTNAPTFLYSLFGLTAAECARVGVTDEVREIVGLDQPNCTVTIETNYHTYSLTLGKAAVEELKDEDGNVTGKLTSFYGVSGDHPDILYRFDSSSLEVMNIQAEKLISNLFLMPYIYSLSSVHYTDPSGRDVDLGFETIKAQEEGGEDVHKFTLNGEPTDEAAAKNLYQYLISASGEELYFDDDKGDLLAEITYTYIDPNEGLNGKDIVRFYESNTDRKVIIELNGGNLFKTRRMYVTQLFANIDKYLAGEEIVLTY